MIVRGQGGYFRYEGYAAPAFQILAELPSAETVKVLAAFIDVDDHRPPESGGFGAPAIHARRTLGKLLEDPPINYTHPIEPWLQWRDEIEAGQRTFRLKGSETRYNFKGPVSANVRNPRDPKRPSAEKTTATTLAVEEESRNRPPAAVIAIAGILLLGAIGWFIRSRRPVAG